MFEFLRRRKLERLRKRADTLRRRAEHYRSEWVRIGYEAYYMDQMAEPLRWGRTQNACNWAGHHMRCANDQLVAVEKQIAALEERRA